MPQKTTKNMIEEKDWDEDGEIRWEDSNIGMIGSNEDKALRKQCAQDEQCWTALPENSAGVWVWRIENFQVVPWPENKWGKFHENDSYIVLLAEEQLEEDGSTTIDRDIYYWLGKTSTADEKGTAALKTIELDDFYDGTANQNREVQGKESGDFQDIFEKKYGGLTYLAGGVESGFNPAIPDVYHNRLLRIRRKIGTKCFFASEVDFEATSLCQADAYVLDAGEKMWVWHGEECSPFAKNKAGVIAHNLCNDRPGAEELRFGADADFWALLKGGPEDVRPCEDAHDSDLEDPDLGHGILYKIQAQEGKALEMEEVGRDELNRSMLDSTAVMLLWTRLEVFIWVGKETSEVEKRCPVRFGMQYIKTNDLPKDTSITVLREGNRHVNKDWDGIFGGNGRKGNGGMCGTAGTTAR